MQRTPSRLINYKSSVLLFNPVWPCLTPKSCAYSSSLSLGLVWCPLTLTLGGIQESRLRSVQIRHLAFCCSGAKPHTACVSSTGPPHLLHNMQPQCKESWGKKPRVMDHNTGRQCHCLNVLGPSGLSLTSRLTQHILVSGFSPLFLWSSVYRLALFSRIMHPTLPLPPISMKWRCLFRRFGILHPSRRQWHPTPVLLPGKSHGWRSLVGYSPWGHRVGHDWATSLSLFTFMHWRRKWQPTPVFLPGESQGQRSLVGFHLWGRTGSDTTDAT